jgi:hypothetical protein
MIKRILLLVLLLLLQLLSGLRQHIDNSTCEDGASQIYIQQSSLTNILKISPTTIGRKALKQLGGNFTVQVNKVQAKLRKDKCAHI